MFSRDHQRTRLKICARSSLAWVYDRDLLRFIFIRAQLVQSIGLLSPAVAVSCRRSTFDLFIQIISIPKSRTIPECHISDDGHRTAWLQRVLHCAHLLPGFGGTSPQRQIVQRWSSEGVDLWGHCGRRTLRLLLRADHWYLEPAHQRWRIRWRICAKLWSDLLPVADNFGVATYAVFLFTLTIWWGRQWGNATACPYTYMEQIVQGMGGERCSYTTISQTWWSNVKEFELSVRFAETGCEESVIKIVQNEKILNCKFERMREIFALRVIKFSLLRINFNLVLVRYWSNHDWEQHVKRVIVVVIGKILTINW